MKTIKIIDLLNKIANGEEMPKKITYSLLRDEYKILIYDEEEQEYRYENDYNEFWHVPNHHLNDEVEIIEEEKEIEKIPYCYSFGFIDCGGLSDVARDELDKNFNYFKDKINELIDAVNEIRKEK